jgi:hypothetical protein
MTTTTNTPTIVRRSHWVGLDHAGRFQKEEVFTTYAATWRGRPVLVTMSADRYEHSSGVSEWRIYASEAREEPAEGHYQGENLTDTARRRLSDQHKQVVRDWLESDDYHRSEAQAYADALRRVASDLRPYMSEPASGLRRALATNRDKLIPLDVHRFEQAADAFDTYAAILHENT